MKKGQTAGKEKKYRSIGGKVGRVVAVMQVVSFVLAMTICVFMFKSLITRMQEERCTNGTNILARELERLSRGDDVNQLLDELKSSMDCEFTIFEGDTRAYSTVTKDGERVVGTKLSSELNEIVLQKGQAYVGEADILGTDYLCSYVPTKGENGQINGLIFAGISMAAVNEETFSVIIWASGLSLIAIALCAVFLVGYLKKRVSDPMGEITEVAKRLEMGDLGISNGKEVQVCFQSNDEIGMLGQIFEDTTHRLRAYIGEITDVLDSIAKGNLTESARQEYMGDFHSIKVSLDKIQSGLNHTMGQIAASAGQVSSGSDNVSSSAQSMAQGATQQASSIQEVSATIADISESARRTTAAAEEAGEYVDRAGAQLGISIDYVKELNEAMGRISDSSQKISTIIATIENIAFQINILALNAAVEAARAGTAGKGFAVVADEVSNLAAKSEEATKATKELIESSIATVAEGGEAVNRVTESLEKTGQIAENVTTKVAFVVEAVEKQTKAIEQVTDGIGQISNVVQTNSATSEECAAASQQLSSQAGLLKNLMNSFELNGTRR
ncbi:MAG: methyl-accepting chemotaxis protein [Dorea sp.]|nr:methyl-accepting chemotaxis protein [Dorea sp.]